MIVGAHLGVAQMDEWWTNRRQSITDLAIHAITQQYFTWGATMTDPYSPPTEFIRGWTPPPAPSPPPPRPKPGRVPWIISGVSMLVALGAILFGLGIFTTGGPSPLHRAGTFALTGSITLNGVEFQDWLPEGNAGCEGTGGYSDMTAGTAVVVADSTGKTVATGSLGTGQVQIDMCMLPISVPNVPGGLSEYVVTVSHRGSQVVPGAQANQPLQLTLGGN
jgi:hypothetical protein